MDFREFFRVAAGNEPYDYQCRFADGLPDVVEVPTGTGKTKAIVVGWFYRRFAHPDPAVRATTPRMLVYALPIGVLVESVMKDVSDVWANLVKDRDSLEATLPPHLPIVQLMGGTLDTQDIAGWRVGMEGESVVVGTVDQVVSRQLMRGYGVSRRAYPIDFARVTNGAHVVVDEVQLCGQATSTTRQIAAFQQNLGALMTSAVSDAWSPTAEPTGLTCMSATVEPTYLDTVDNPWQGPASVTLSEEDRRGRLSVRLEGTRRVERLQGGSTEKHIVAAALEAHRPGTLTLVVVNRVAEAVEIHAALNKELPKTDATPRTMLVHSRFRARERKILNDELQQLTGPDGLAALQDTPGCIVVATQTVEAGIDLDAATLITEAASWPSLCQRAGRCNRAGTFGSGAETTARLLWVDTANPLPYEKADVDASVAALTELEGTFVTSEDLLDHPVVGSADALSILRSPTFLQLFDTAPDLAGADIDVSRYIRSDRDTDVRFAWVDAPALEGDPVLARPAPAWQVSVPVSAARAFLTRKSRPRAWLYDRFSQRWMQVRAGTKLQPQDLVLVNREDGGYDAVTGFDPAHTERVALIDTDPSGDTDDEPNSGTDTSPSDDRASQTRGTDLGADDAGGDPGAFVATGWQLLEEHLREAAEEAERLCDSLGFAHLGFDEGTARAVVTAVALHDLGKAFPGWQRALKTTRANAEGTYVGVTPPPHGLLAKSPDSAVGTSTDEAKTSSSPAPTPVRRLIVRANPLGKGESAPDVAPEGSPRPLLRPVFRHELVSVLLLRTTAGRELLTSRGVPAERHALVDYLVGAHHGVLRVTPRDPVADGRTGATFLGVIDGEWIPPVEIASATLPGTVADLSLFGAGEGSWGRDVARLLEEFGPFRLAYLESLVRISDWRVSGAAPATGANR